MDKNKKIISYCKNFYKIINFVPYESDVITEKIIAIYKKYIFKIDVNNKEDLETVKELDFVLNKYIDDFLFRKEFQKQILTIKVEKDAKDILKELIKSMLKIFYRYEESSTRVIYISRWI